MLIHLLNPLLQAHNDTAVVALRRMPLIELSIGYRMLAFHIVEAWCIQRPTGDYANCLSAFAAAWRIKP